MKCIGGLNHACNITLIYTDAFSLNLSDACLGESVSVFARIFAGLMAEGAAERGG